MWTRRWFEKIIEWMKILYGDNMRISKGKKHDYLGMNIDFLLKVKAEVTMVEHPKGVIYDLEKVETLTSTAALSAAKHLYTVREE